MAYYQGGAGYYNNSNPGYSSYSNGGYNARKRGRDFDDYNGETRRGQYRRMDDSIAPYRGNDYSGYSARHIRGAGHGGGGYGRRSNNNKHYDRDVQVLLSVGEKYCCDLWRFGDEIPVQSSAEEGSRFPNLNTEDIEALKVETREVWAKMGREDVLRGFRIAWVWGCKV